MELLYVANPMLWVQDRELWQFCQYLDPLYCLTWLKPAFVIRLQLIVHAQSILFIRMLCPPRSHAKFSVTCIFQALLHCTSLGGAYVATAHAR